MHKLWNVKSSLLLEKIMKKKSLYLKLIWAFVGLSWIALIGVFILGPDVKAWTIAVTGVAIVTEIGFWLTAGLFGLTMWESRKRIFTMTLKPFKQG